MIKIDIIDSHTGGEPTRLIVGGGPDLGSGTVASQLLRFKTGFDHIRSGVLREPRGSDVLVGAQICTPSDPGCSAAVLFFNNVGYLGMCGHGMIGVVTTLKHLNRLGTGVHRIETPVGVVQTEAHADGSVTVHNVPAYRHKKGIRLNVDGYGEVMGDIAWGGNWFFLVSEHPFTSLDIKSIDALITFTTAVRCALAREHITGKDNAEIDHIELFADSDIPGTDSKNFVLCPGNAYDRSPCGTGTSAKIACLASDGKLAPGQIWRQASIIGSVFEASYAMNGDLILPSIRGTAHITAQASLLFQADDPFIWGIS